jgi:hypothetical protein
MCVFHSSQFTFMTRNQAAQPPNIIVDTKSGGNSAPDLVSKSVVAFQAKIQIRTLPRNPTPGGLLAKLIQATCFSCLAFTKSARKELHLVSFVHSKL